MLFRFITSIVLLIPVYILLCIAFILWPVSLLGAAMNISEPQELGTYIGTFVLVNVLIVVCFKVVSLLANWTENYGKDRPKRAKKERKPAFVEDVLDYGN